MTFREFKYLLAADLFRQEGKTGKRAFLREFFRNITFRYLTFWRLRGYLRKHPVFRWGFYRVCLWFVSHYTYKLGIRIPQETAIGPGLYIGHWGIIFINRAAILGNNCTISQGITLGELNHGEKKGAPVIGDNVYIGPGATIIGNVKIGDNALIGANSLVVTDVPDDGVMIGVPAKLFSKGGSGDLVNHTVDPPTESGEN